MEVAADSEGIYVGGTADGTIPGVPRNIRTFDAFIRKSNPNVFQFMGPLDKKLCGVHAVTYNNGGKTRLIIRDMLIQHG